MMQDQEDRRQNNMSMDETEDEEVKRNCFGKKYYESYSEGDESGEESDYDIGTIAPPQKFVSHNEDDNVHKPTALAFQLQRILEMSNIYEDAGEGTESENNEHAHHCHKRKHIIHNECEFSDDENDCISSDDESVREQSSYSTETNLDEFDDNESENASVSKEEEVNSTVEESESEASEEDAHTHIGAESTFDVESEADEEWEANSLDGDAESESTSVADEDSDDSGAACEENNGLYGDEEDAPDSPPQAKVILDWSQHALNEAQYSPSLLMKVSGSKSNDSVSAGEIEHLIEKEESGEICFSDIDAGEGDEDIIADEDVMKCLINADEDVAVTKLLPLKRVQVMNVSSDEDRPNRKRFRGLSIKAPYLPVLSFSQPAEMKLMYRCSPQLSDSSEEDKVDSQLAEELMEDNVSDKPELTAPVPLLTPPGTPMEHRTSSDGAELCEWPSNLAVDNAMTAAIELRSLSPSSLAKLEEQNPTCEDLTTPTFPQRRLRSVSEASTGLTPLLHSLKMHPMFRT